MPANDIIDNRNEKLVSHISSTESGRFAVGKIWGQGLKNHFFINHSLPGSSLRSKLPRRNLPCP